MQRTYATADQQDYASYLYSLNGKQTRLTDANGNPASMTYDGFDREVQWNFPSATTPGTVSTSDYEAYTYDPGGNRLTLRKRDGVTLTYQYDDAGRLALKTVPASASGGAGYSVAYGYDATGAETYARFGSAWGLGITTAYDGFERVASSGTNMDGTARTLTYGYDADGNAISLTSSAGPVVQRQYDGADRIAALRWGAYRIATFAYDAAGRRSSLGLGIDTVTSSASWTYDGAGRLQTLGGDFAGTSADRALTFAYNPASQIVGRTISNEAYVANSAYDVSRTYSVNGLNQYTAAGAATFTYDLNGNLTGDGTNSYVYDAENRLVSAARTVNGVTTTVATLSYDPHGRLWQVTGPAGTRRLVYDGDRLVEEYDPWSLTAVYVHGPDADEPLMSWDAATGWARRYLHTDHQGSIVALADDDGNAASINAYDEWGIPNAGNQGRFGYTGQAWLPELGMWYYKARIYSPTLGRFLQTDPVGFKDQVNLYAYVGNDPLDQTDPTGEECTDSECRPDTKKAANIDVIGTPEMDRSATAAMPLNQNPMWENPFTGERAEPVSVGLPKVGGGLSIEVLKGRASSGGGGDRLRVEVPGTAVYMEHGHLRQDNGSYTISDQPGRNQGWGDADSLRRSNPIPNYIVAHDRLARFDAPGGILRFKMLIGKMNGIEMMEMNEHVNAEQTRLLSRWGSR